MTWVCVPGNGLSGVDSFFGRELLAGDIQQFLLFLRDFRVMQLQALNPSRDDVGDDSAGDPLVIRWDDVPRGPSRARRPEGVLIRTHVVVPVVPLREVVRRELPVLLLPLEPLQEPGLLLLL